MQLIVTSQRRLLLLIIRFFCFLFRRQTLEVMVSHVPQLVDEMPVRVPRSPSCDLAGGAPRALLIPARVQGTLTSLGSAETALRASQGPLIESPGTPHSGRRPGPWASVIPAQVQAGVKHLQPRPFPGPALSGNLTTQGL